MPTYRLAIEYEGTRFRGWQEQKNARSVAGELRRAIEEVVGERVELGGAGRTDAGVHALEQVAHLRVGRRLPPGARFAAEVNDRLPAEIHLRAVAPAPERFHARHHAQLRSYLYQVSRRRTALAKRFVWWVRRELDAGSMAAAAAAIAGRHDFATFCEQPEEQSSTLVVVERAEVVEAGELILVRIAASHFLWKMVRRLVGALVEVGAGELAAAQLAALIDAPAGAHRGFRPAEHTAPPSGLFLERVIYEGDAPLGAVVPAVPVA
ncbi:MAG: tRNA pseudouridine synthase A [Acidobacteriota bacterium]